MTSFIKLLLIYLISNILSLIIKLDSPCFFHVRDIVPLSTRENQETQKKDTARVIHDRLIPISKGGINFQRYDSTR